MSGGRVALTLTSAVLEGALLVWAVERYAFLGKRVRQHA